MEKSETVFHFETRGGSRGECPTLLIIYPNPQNQINFPLKREGDKIWKFDFYFVNFAKFYKTFYYARK